MKKSYLLLLCSLVFVSTYTAKAQSNADIAVTLNHIGISVTNLQVSTSFYENILRLKQIPEPFHDGKHTWFTIGKAGHLHLSRAIPSHTSATGMITFVLALNPSKVLSQT
jgi:lactoylglutathione lyase